MSAASRRARRPVHLAAVFAVAYGSLAAGGLATAYYFGPEAVRDRYVRILNDDMGLPGSIGRVENVDLSHRRLADIEVWRPDGSAKALTAPDVYVEEEPDGGRVFFVNGAELDLGDAAWMGAIRWPSNPDKPLREIRGTDCTLTVEYALPDGRRLRLRFGGVDGVMDFRDRPNVTADLSVRSLNGHATPRPLRLTGRMVREPRFSVEEIRLRLDPAFPAERLLGDLVSGLPTGLTAAGDLVFRRPAGQTAVTAEVHDLRLIWMGTGAAWDSPASIRCGLVRVNPGKAEIGPWSAELTAGGRTVTLAGDGGSLDKSASGEWSGSVRIGRVNAAEAPGLLLVAGAPARPAQGVPGAVRIALDPQPLAPWAALFPGAAGVRSGRVGAALEVLDAPGGPELLVSAKAEGLSVEEFGRLGGAELSPGRVDVELKSLRIADGRARDLHVAASAEWTVSGERTASASGALRGEFDWTAGRLKWRTDGVRVKSAPADVGADIAGELGWAGGCPTLSAVISSLGGVRLPDPARAEAWLSATVPPTVGFTLSAERLPVADIAGALGLKLPAAAAELDIAAGTWTVGSLPQLVGRAGVAFGGPGKPRGTVECRFDWPEGGAAVRAADLDLSLLSAVPGMPELSGRMSGRIDDVRFAGTRGVRAATVSLGGRLDDLRPLCRHLGAEPFAGEVELTAVEAGVADGRVAWATLTGRARGLDLAQISQAAGYGKVDGQIDVTVHKLRLADAKLEAVRLEAAESFGYRGSRRVSKETLKILGEQAGLTLPPFVFGAVDYDGLGATLTRDADGYLIEGTVNGLGAVSRLKVSRLSIPVVLPESVRRRDAAEFCGLEAALWEAVRGWDFAKMAPAGR
jgi:hypothetical protein